jgi:hypothetical protein
VAALAAGSSRIVGRPTGDSCVWLGTSEASSVRESPANSMFGCTARLVLRSCLGGQLVLAAAVFRILQKVT